MTKIPFYVTSRLIYNTFYSQGFFFRTPMIYLKTCVTDGRYLDPLAFLQFSTDLLQMFSVT